MTMLKDPMSVFFDQDFLHFTFNLTYAVNPTRVNMSNFQM